MEESTNGRKEGVWEGGQKGIKEEGMEKGKRKTVRRGISEDEKWRSKREGEEGRKRERVSSAIHLRIKTKLSCTRYITCMSW